MRTFEHAAIVYLIYSPQTPELCHNTRCDIAPGPNMNPNRRTFLLFTGAAAVSRLGYGQYVLPPQPLPSERFPPSPGQLAEIRRKTALLETSLQDLRKKNIAD